MILQFRRQLFDGMNGSNTILRFYLPIQAHQLVDAQMLISAFVRLTRHFPWKGTWPIVDLVDIARLGEIQHDQVSLRPQYAPGRANEKHPGPDELYGLFSFRRP